MKSVRIYNMMALALLGATSACTMETETSSEPGEPDEFGEASEAIASAGYASWSGSTPVYLGSASDRTCWLAGVHGELWGEHHTTLQEAEANVKVYISNGSWWVSAAAGYGNGVMAHATCMPTSAAVNATRTFHSMSVAVQYAEGWTFRSANKHCFLTELGGVDGWASWNGSAARIWPSTVWLAGTSFPVYKFGLWAGDQSDGYTTTSSRMKAVCFEVPTTYVSTFESAVPGIDQLGMYNSTCGMTGLAGNYYNASWSQGAQIRPGGGNWEVAVDGSNKHIWGKCLM